MKTVALTAPTGMLGSMVYKVLKDKYQLVLVYHDEQKLKLLEERYGDSSAHQKVQCNLMELYEDYRTGFSKETVGPHTRAFVDAIGKVDAFINCVGITKPYVGKDPIATFFLNSALPHVLSMVYKERLIHITTDCVYNGIEGAPYDEQSFKNANDLYGLSKSLGEPKDHSLVLRTSFVGPELASGAGLLSWFLAQKGKTIQGFTNHFWNGITTYELAKIYDKIISKREAYPAAGLFHLFSKDVSKYDMLVTFKKKYNVNVTIERVEAHPVDRRLRSLHDVCRRLAIPDFHTMLDEL